jgi:two-component sensor histidine kinase
MEPSSLINGSQYEEVGMLITELFANIRRHSTPGENAYLIHIEFNEREAIVTQINTVKEHNSMTYERSNKGLGFHKHIIESHGGQLKTSIEDGTWFLYAKIPNSDERHA